MKVLRSTIVVATAIFAAACGDKVQVVGPGTNGLKITSVQVSPLSSTISVGQSTTLTAAINADAGITTSVAWSSSGAAATVTQGGTTTSVAGVASSPGVSVCATVSGTATGATIAPAVSCGTVIISPASQTQPATIQITSITGANLNTPVPVPPGTVAGQINVSVTANPGTEHLDSVVVFVGTKAAGTQTFTDAQAAALRSAGDAARAAQQVVAPLVFSINTAAYSTTTGAVTYPNGSVAISAVAYGKQGSSAATNAASSSVSLLLANADGFQVTVVNNGNKANDAAGFAWWGNGTITLNALPVMYSGKTVGTVTGSLAANTAAGSTCAAGVGAAVSTTTPVAGVWSTILPIAAAQSPAGCTTTFPNMPNIAALDSNGNVLTLVATGILNTQTGVRMDNVAPPTAGLIAALAVNGRTGNWINDAVSLNSVTSGTNLNGAIAAAVVDAGIGGTISYNVRISTTYALAKAAAPLANTSTLAMLATNASYCAISYTADLLGNTQGNPGGTCAAPAASATYVLPAAGVASVPFGVDRVAPVYSYGAAAIAANSRISTATIAAEMVTSFADTGIVGNSGMAPTTPVIASLVLRDGIPTALPAACIVGTGTATACTQSATGMTTTIGTGSSTTGIAGTSVVGYYTFNSTATDAAGNSSTVAPRVFVYDNTPATVGIASTPVTVSGTAGFAASAFISEDLDIQSFSWQVNYATLPFAPAAVAQGNPTAVNGFNANPFINTNYVATSSVTLPLAFQQDPTGATLYPLSGVQAIATNQGNLAATGAAGAPTTVTPGTAISITGFTSYPAPALPATIVSVSSGVTTAATATAPLTSTLSATAVGVTATFNNPFNRVDFYAQNAAATQWIFIGSVATPSLVDIGGNRTFTWALPVSGATLYTNLGLAATTTVQVMGVGMGAANLAIGMIPVATFGLNIVK